MSGEDELRAVLDALRKQENPDPNAVRELVEKAVEQYREAMRTLYLELEDARHLGPNLAGLKLPEADELMLWGTERTDARNYNDVVASLVRWFHDAGGADAAARLLLAFAPPGGVSRQRWVVSKQAFAFLARELLKDDALSGDLRRALVEATLGTSPRDRRQVSQEQIESARAYIRENRGARDSEVSRHTKISPPIIAELRRTGVLPERQV